MGVDAGDPDGKGLPWLWCTNYENELHALYRNLSNKARVCFVFYTPASGIAAISARPFDETKCESSPITALKRSVRRRSSS